MKYIDAEKLKERLEDMKRAEYENCGGVNAKTGVLYEVQELIDSLQQEQPNDVRAEIEEYYGEDLAFDDERTKAAYHFFSAGKAFELREYEEERKRHITGLLDNFQKGMKAGYEKAISELKEGKVECSPIIKEFIDKLFATGNAFNFGFGSKDIKQEQPQVADASKMEQPEVELEKAARYVYESWMGGTMNDVRRDMVELGKVLNARGRK